MDTRQPVNNFDVRLDDRKMLLFLFDKLSDIEAFRDDLKKLGQIKYPDNSYYPYYFNEIGKDGIQTVVDNYVDSDNVSHNVTRYILKMHPFTYNTFNPGASMPNAEFKRGKGNPPAWQIIFADQNEDEANKCVADLHNMRSLVIKIDDSEVEATKNST